MNKYPDFGIFVIGIVFNAIYFLAPNIGRPLYIGILSWVMADYLYRRFLS